MLALNNLQNGISVNINMLTGEGQYITAAAQTTMDAQAFTQASKAAHKAGFCLPPSYSPTGILFYYKTRSKWTLHELCRQITKCSVSSVQSLSCPTLWPHRLQHTRLPCSSPIPGACSNSCPSSWWCHSTVSSSVIPVSSCLQSFLAWGSFLRSQVFASKCYGPTN